jgi:hypothetical protein
VGGAYDWLNLSTAPNQVRPGGYAQQYTTGQGWQQVTDAHVPPSAYRQQLRALGISRGAVRASR